MDALQVLRALDERSLHQEQRLNAKKAFLSFRGYSWDKLKSASEDEIIRWVEKEGVKDFIQWADSIISYFTGKDDFTLFVPSGWSRLYEENKKGHPEDILKRVYLFNDICNGYSIGATEADMQGKTGPELQKVLQKIQASRATAVDVLWAAYLTAKGDED